MNQNLTRNINLAILVCLVKATNILTGEAINIFITRWDKHSNQRKSF